MLCVSLVHFYVLYIYFCLFSFLGRILRGVWDRSQLRNGSPGFKDAGGSPLECIPPEVSPSEKVRGIQALKTFLQEGEEMEKEIPKQIPQQERRGGRDRERGVLLGGMGGRPPREL